MVVRKQQKNGDGDASSHEFASSPTRNSPEVVETGVMAGNSYSLAHAVVPLLEMVLPELRQTSSNACGLSVSLSLRGLGFCEAALAGSHISFL